jgi:hypothetical protein
LKIFRRHGPDTLGKALAVATTAWGKTATAVDGGILLGLALVISHYDTEIDWQEACRVFAKCPGGAAGIIGKARGLRAAMPTRSMPWCIARVMVERYNTNRRTSRIIWNDDAQYNPKAA